MISSKHTAGQQPTPPTMHPMERQAVLWVLSSTTGVLTTSLLLASDPSIADTLLLIHVTLALIACIYKHGPRMFLHLPTVSAQEWRYPVGLRPRPIKCIWIDWLCRVLYVVCTTVSLLGAIRAIAELQNLPVTIVLMQVGTIPRDLWMTCFGLMWTRSMCRRDWAELRFQSTWLAYQVTSVIGFCWLCWSYSRDHLTGVLSALASSISAGMATVLHRWIADDIRNQAAGEMGVRCFDAVVLAINAAVLAGTIYLRSNSITGLINVCQASRALFTLNILSGALAIYTAGGVSRRLRTSEDMFWLSWTNMCIAIAWCTILIACEMAIGLGKLSPWEMTMCIAFMAGRQPIEESYQAFASVASWIGRRRARSIL